jgi:hypothetical protein
MFVVGVGRQHRAGVHQRPLQTPRVGERTRNQTQDRERGEEKNGDGDHHLQQRKRPAGGQNGLAQVFIGSHR